MIRQAMHLNRVRRIANVGKADGGAWFLVLLLQADLELIRAGREARIERVAALAGKRRRLAADAKEERRVLQRLPVNSVWQHESHARIARRGYQPAPDAATRVSSVSGCAIEREMRR